MTKSLYLLIAGAILAWSACNCPPNEKIGELNLAEATQGFLPYDGSEVLSFVDETGASLQLTSPEGRNTQENQLCTRTTCTEAKYGSPSSCEYYASESWRYTFINNDQNLVIDLLLYSEVYNRDDATFYDALQAAFSLGTPSVVGHHLIESRFSEEVNLSEISLTDFFTLKESLELNGLLFTDVLQYEEGDLALYIKEGVGLVGFKNKTHSWVLQP